MQKIISGNGMDGIVFRFTKKEIIKPHKIKVTHAIREDVKTIRFPWDIFQLNDWAIRQDFELLTKNRNSQPISKTNKLINTSQIFIEKGAKVEHSILNASTGPIYIGKNAEVMEGCMIRWPFSSGDGYLGNSVIGSWCNLGAGTGNSNFKNNASDIGMWTPKGELNAGIKCGLMMGDYSKTAINTSINTGY